MVYSKTNQNELASRGVPKGLTDIKWGARVCPEAIIQIFGQSWTRATKLRLSKHNDTDRCTDDPAFDRRKRFGRSLRKELNAEIKNNRMTVSLSLLRMLVSSSVPHFEHRCTSVVDATLPSIASTTVTCFEIWQLTSYQFDDDDSLENGLLYQNSLLTWTKYSQE